MRPPKLLVALSVLLALGTSDAAPPHITFFLVDDLGWNDVSMHGSKQIQTPNIDSLAASGIRLNNYYVNPVCSPTRASLLSGRSVIHHGIYTPYNNGNAASGLNLSYTLLPQHLKASYGYACYAVGKWHLGNFFPKPDGKKNPVNEKWPVSSPRVHGFDEWHSTEASASSSMLVD